MPSWASSPDTFGPTTSTLRYSMPGPRAVFEFYNGCLLGLIATRLGFERG